MLLKTESWLRRIRDALRRGGSPEYATGVQSFFKEEVRSHGWYTVDLRRFARKTSREIQTTDGLEALVQVADRLFTSKVLERKSFRRAPAGEFGRQVRRTRVQAVRRLARPRPQLA
jgi:hypothetical protein